MPGEQVGDDGEPHGGAGADHGRDRGDAALAVGDDVLHGAEGVAATPQRKNAASSAQSAGVKVAPASTSP